MTEKLAELEKEKISSPVALAGKLDEHVVKFKKLKNDQVSSELIMVEFKALMRTFDQCSKIILDSWLITDLGAHFTKLKRVEDYNGSDAIRIAKVGSRQILFQASTEHLGGLIEFLEYFKLGLLKQRFWQVTQLCKRAETALRFRRTIVPGIITKIRILSSEEETTRELIKINSRQVGAMTLDELTRTLGWENEFKVYKNHDDGSEAYWALALIDLMNKVVLLICPYEEDHIFKNALQERVGEAISFVANFFEAAIVALEDFDKLVSCIVTDLEVIIKELKDETGNKAEKFERIDKIVQRISECKFPKISRKVSIYVTCDEIENIQEVKEHGQIKIHMAECRERNDGSNPGEYLLAALNNDLSAAIGKGRSDDKVELAIEEISDLIMVVNGVKDIVDFKMGLVRLGQ